VAKVQFLSTFQLGIYDLEEIEFFNGFLHWKKLSSSLVFCIGRNLVVKWFVGPAPGGSGSD